MIVERLQSLTEEALLRICENRLSESQTLDFKRNLPDTSTSGKSEFLKDVCSLCNAEGGDLLYGIDVPKSGGPYALAPSPELPDSTTLRLGQVVASGIEPRLVGVRVHPVQVSDGHVVVVRVPASFDGPHRVGHTGRFYMRNDTHNTELSYEQLRSAFDRTASLTERAGGFIRSRLDQIIAGKTWRPMVAGPICVVLLVPLASLRGRTMIDVAALQANLGKFAFGDWGGGITRTSNLDGLVVHPRQYVDDAHGAYTQIYRKGIFEAVRTGAGQVFGDRKVIPSTTVTA